MIQIKTTPNLKETLGYIKVHEKKSFTELIEEWIEFHYYLTFYNKEQFGDFRKGKIRDLFR